MAVVAELDEVELRALLDEAIAEAFELADELASLVAAGDQSASARSEISRVTANYLQARTLVRRCRGVIAVEAGRR